MASKKRPKSSRTRGAHPLSVRERMAIRFGGPPDQEQIQRHMLETNIAHWLRAACPRFARTRQPEIQAARIVAGLPYHPASRPVLDVRKLSVDYQNDRASGAHGRWKVWIRVENWTDTAQGKAGAFASTWGQPPKPAKRQKPPSKPKKKAASRKSTRKK